MIEKPKRQVKRNPWFKRIAAILILIVGVGATLGFMAYQENEAARQQAEAYAIAQAEYEAILNQPLFDNPPQIFEYGGYVTFDNYAARIQMEQAGMDWIALSYTFERDDDPSHLIEQIQAAHTGGAKVLLSISGTVSFDVTNDTQAYADYLGELAAGGADAIEIWQTPNLSRSAPKPNFVENYAYILQVSAEAIREANPDTLIISGAPAPTGAESAFPGEVVNDDNFLRQLMEAGVLDIVDCVGMQYLEGTVPPTATNGDARDNYYTRYLPTMLESYQAILGEDMPICVTAIGYFSSEGINPTPEFYAWASATSREEQHEWLSEAIEWLMLQENVPLALIWHIDHEDHPEIPAEVHAGYSLTYPAQD